MHNNFLQSFSITDGAYDAEMINPDWLTDPEAPMQGNEWWPLVEPAISGFAKWKHTAIQNLNIVDSVKTAKTPNSLILAVINDSLSDDFTPLM